MKTAISFIAWASGVLGGAWAVDEWFLPKLFPKITLLIGQYPWIGVVAGVIFVGSGAFWLGLHKRYKPVQPQPLAPHLPPGATRVETVSDTTKPGITRTVTTVEYLDGLPTTPNPSRRSLFEKARELEAKSQFNQAIPLFQKLLVQPETPSEELALLILIGNCFLDLSQLHEAQQYYTEALAKAQRLKNEDAEAAALGNLGNVYFQKGDLDKALEHHQKALVIHEKIGNPLGQASDLGNLGNVYFQKGDLDKALEHHQKALKQHEQIGNPLGQALALGNLGLVYFQKGDLDKALEHLQKALKQHEQIGNPLGQALALGNLGLVYRH
ncbi:MAG: tetratricopeptide repeat protein, partial [Dehalococcoidia bacterium]|nr:tetratricopeptide repeat protein [Dehalococcoidia bacterium]